MRTVFSAEDIKNIIERVYNGNLAEANNADFVYDNPCSETINITYEDTGETAEADLAQHLNIVFYTWRQRVLDNKKMPLAYSRDWATTISSPAPITYALVEMTDEEVTASQDIDNATKIGRITFLVAEDKASTLDYYITKVRSSFLGAPVELQNAKGDILDAYLVMGIPLYTEEPAETPIGKMLKITVNFKLSYLAQASTYSDIEVALCLDDTIIDESDNIVGEFLTMPITNMTWQSVQTSTSMPINNNPAVMASMGSALSLVKSMTFYDFNNDLTNAINKIMWSHGATYVDGVAITSETSSQQLNKIVWLRIKVDGSTYIYKDFMDKIVKNITNNDFTTTTISLKLAH